MSQKSPILFIHGTIFIAVNERKFFFELNNPRNRIDINNLKDEGGYHTTLYDTLKKNIYDGWVEWPDKESPIKRTVFIDEILNMEAHPPEDFIKAVNKASSESKWGVTIPEYPLYNRINGRLPTVDIAGWNFIVEIKENRLFNLHDQSGHLYFDQLPKNRFGDGFDFLFNNDNASIYPNDSKYVKTEEDLALVYLPSLEELDPIGMAWTKKTEDAHFLDKFPYKPHHKAGVFQLGHVELSDETEKPEVPDRKTGRRR